MAKKLPITEWSDEAKRNIVWGTTIFIVAIIVIGWFFSFRGVMQIERVESNDSQLSTASLQAQFSEQGELLQEQMAEFQIQMAKLRAAQNIDSEQSELLTQNLVAKLNKLELEPSEENMAEEALPTETIDDELDSFFDEDKIVDVADKELPEDVEKLSASVLSSVLDTANWKTYTNADYGFKLSYPSGWIWRQSKDEPTVYFINTQVPDEAVAVTFGEDYFTSPETDPDFQEAIVIDQQPAVIYWRINKKTAHPVVETVIINDQYYLAGEGEVFNAIVLSLEFLN